MQFLEDNIGENQDDFGLAEDFLGTTPKVQSMKEIIDKLDFLQFRTFALQKIIIKRIRR